MGLGEEVWIFYTIMSVLFKLHYQYIHCIYNKTFHVYKQRYERAVVRDSGQPWRCAKLERIPSYLEGSCR